MAGKSYADTSLDGKWTYLGTIVVKKDPGLIFERMKTETNRKKHKKK